MTKNIVGQVVYATGAVVFTALVLSRFAVIIQPVLAINYTGFLEFGMVIGQVLFQWAVLARRPFAVKWEYALLVLSVSLMGAVLLIPMVMYHHFHPVGLVMAIVYFFGVVGVMFGVHWWRVKAMGLSWILCATWVLYRCILLTFIVKWP